MVFLRCKTCTDFAFARLDSAIVSAGAPGGAPTAWTRAGGICIGKRNEEKGAPPTIIISINKPKGQDTLRGLTKSKAQRARARLIAWVFYR